MSGMGDCQLPVGLFVLMQHVFLGSGFEDARANVARPTSSPNNLTTCPQPLQGFIPSSLLSPLNVAAVIEAERPLLATAAAGAIVAQLETQGQPGQAADGADLDPVTRAAARKQALEAVLLGRQVTAQVVNVDAASGRVVLSGAREVFGRREAHVAVDVCVTLLEAD